MLSTFERRKSQREVVNEIPVYPTETIMWDENQIPSVNYTGGKGRGALAVSVG
jgi:intron-binding protein aquarius